MNTKKVSTSMESLSPIITTMLEENRDITLAVTGNSMYPLFAHKRDSVILASCNKFDLSKGDIPLYKRNNGQYVLHRIVKVNENSYDLCGDNQYIIEKNLPKKNIIAVVKAFERKGKVYSCNDFFYKLYWKLRIASIPFRSFVHRGFAKMRRIVAYKRLNIR